MNTEVIDEYGEMNETDKKSFHFNLFSNGRLKQPMRFEITNLNYGYWLYEKSNDELIRLGNICLFKENLKNKSFCDEKITSNPEAHAEYQDEKQRLRNAIDALPFLQRSVIILRYYNNMQLTDIADSMDISLSSVKRYMNTAKDTLRNALV